LPVDRTGEAVRQEPAPSRIYEHRNVASSGVTLNVKQAVCARRASTPHLDTSGWRRLTTSMDASELAATARMARLSLSAEDFEKLGMAVEQMLAHFSHMKEIDVEGLAPTTHALLRKNRLREDVESPSRDPDLLLDNAPEREERFIVVPNVL